MKNETQKGGYLLSQSEYYKNRAEYRRSAADLPRDTKEEFNSFDPKSINLPPNHPIHALWGERLPVSLALKSGYACYYYAGEKFTLTKLKFTLANLDNVQAFAWDANDKKDPKTEANFWSAIAKLLNAFNGEGVE